MIYSSRFVGHETPLAELRVILGAHQAGRGGLVLVAGEAGIGKTRLLAEALSTSDLPVIRESIIPNAGAYAPLVGVLRACLRLWPDLLVDCGRLADHLAVLLPEVGASPEESDRSTLIEAIRCAFDAVAKRKPTIIVLDDLQWADHATLEVLPLLAASFESRPLLFIGAYRSDEIPRNHPLRRMRNELRRQRLLHEITVEPLSPSQVIELASQLLGATPDSLLASTLYARTDGYPLFVEELAVMLSMSGRLRRTEAGYELIDPQDVPLPDTVRDAILARMNLLSPGTQQVLEIAAIAGLNFDFDLLTELGGADEGLEEALGSGLIVENVAGHGIFRHGLAQEAIYTNIAWPRRKRLHLQVAVRMETRGAPPIEIARHYLAGREHDKARRSFIEAAKSFCDRHAYRDAADAIRQALELWPDGVDDAQRLAVLDRLGLCAELCGEFAEASRVLREVIAYRQTSPDQVQLANAHRRLASVYDLQGAWEQAISARRAAARIFDQCGLYDEAAQEQMAVADRLHLLGQYSAALETASQAGEKAQQAGHVELDIRALALHGEILAALDQTETGREAVENALARALENKLIGAAAEAYWRLGNLLQRSANYEAARDTYQTAVDFCQTNGVSEMAHLCLACLAVLLRDTGDWERGISVCKGIRESEQVGPASHGISSAMLAFIYAYRGQTRRAGTLLKEALVQAHRVGIAPLEMECVWGLAYVDALNGSADSAIERCRQLIQLGERSEDKYYIIPALRWVATYLARQSLADDTRACASLLSKIVSVSARPIALSALAHVIGEIALLEGNVDVAVRQFSQSLDILRTMELPVERAQVHLRMGAALVAAAQRDLGIEQISDAYRIARKLDARPLANEAVGTLAELGEQIEHRLGWRAATEVRSGGLSRREMEVLRHIAQGRTNREVASDLFLSTRTVDMYLRNILNKLDCRSRIEAIRKAEQLGIIE